MVEEQKYMNKEDNSSNYEKPHKPRHIILLGSDPTLLEMAYKSLKNRLEGKIDTEKFRLSKKGAN